MAQDHCDETKRTSDIHQPPLSVAPVLQCGCWRRQNVFMIKTNLLWCPHIHASPLQMCRAELGSRCSEPTGQTGMRWGRERSARTAGSPMGERGGYLWEDLWWSHKERNHPAPRYEGRLSRVNVPTRLLANTAASSLKFAQFCAFYNCPLIFLKCTILTFLGL